MVALGALGLSCSEHLGTVRGYDGVGDRAIGVHCVGEEKERAIAGWVGDLLECFAVGDLEGDVVMAVVGCGGCGYGENGITAFCSAVVEDDLCLVLSIVREGETCGSDDLDGGVGGKHSIGMAFVLESRGQSIEHLHADQDKRKEV